MEFITTCREVQLTIAGLVPRADWQLAVLFDIGSGNTKGGFFRSRRKGRLPQRAARECDSRGPGIEGAGRQAFWKRRRTCFDPHLSKLPLAEQAKANPELSARRVVFVSGGAPYAMTTLIHPEAILQDRITLTASDITKYRKLRRSTPRVPSPDFTSLADPKVRSSLRKNLARYAIPSLART